MAQELGNIPLFDVDPEIEKIVDDYFLTKEIKKVKMYKESDIINVIQECIDRPKGIVPDSVYTLIPHIKF